MNQNSSFWDLKQNDTPGLSEGQIQKWEADQGVQLPQLFRTVYRESDGGVVRATTIQLSHLHYFENPCDQMWSWGLEDSEGFEVRELVYVIGEDLNVGGNYLLNYNRCDNDGEPSLWNYFHDGTGVSLLGGSASQYLLDASRVAEFPDVDWQESAKFPILADESIDELSGTVSRYLLVQGSGCLIVFREGPDYNFGGKRLTRTELPLPLDVECMLLRQPLLERPWMLQLQPEESDGIVSRESVQTSGGWKNQRYQGAPIYEMIASHSRDRLEALRVQLIGAEAAQAARDEEQRMANLQNLVTSKPETSQVMFMQMMNAMSDLLPDLNPPGDVPDESAGAFSNIAQFHKQMMEEVNRHVAGSEVPPEVQAVIDSMKKKFGSRQT